jgi:hypothetical protein
MLRRTHWSLWLLLLGAGCSPLGDFAIAIDPIELGVAAQLEAVTLDHRQDRLYIVGSGGLVIDDLGNQWELPATLRDVTHVEGDDRYPSRPPRLIVVGADGFLASAPNPDDAALEFEVEAVGTQADLWAVAADRGKELRVAVVGDDVLIVGTEDDLGELVWTHPPAPPDGWGSLRDVDLDLGCAIGQAGRMLCTSGDISDGWQVVELDTNENLNSFCAFYPSNAVGDAGTLVSYDGDGWTVVRVEPAIDLIACTEIFVDPVIVGGDRTIYTISSTRELEPLVKLDWQPRALEPHLGTVLVGDTGRAGVLSPQ